MAGGQGAAGRGRPAPALTGAVRFRDLAEARAAGGEALLVSAPEVAALAGVGFLKAVEEALGRPIVVDCGGDAGLVMAALRAGLRDLLFSGEERLAGPLAEMAAAVGGRLRTGLLPVP